jgi:hypothetical protein
MAKEEDICVTFYSRIAFGRQTTTPPTMAIDRAPNNRLRLMLARDAGLRLVPWVWVWEAAGRVLEAVSMLSHAL